MAQSPSNAGSQAEQNFRELLSKFHNAMLVTHSDHAGIALHARPMAIAETGADGSLWFITGADTPKISDIHEHDQVLAVMQNDKQWLSVCGKAELERDREHIHKVWKEPFRAWFQGKDDPNIVLIHLRPSEAEYWDSSGVKGIKFALQYAAAYVTGKELRGPQSSDIHAKVTL